MADAQAERDHAGPLPRDHAGPIPRAPGARQLPERARNALTGGDAVPPAVAPPEGHPRFPLIDGIRALAALAIVVTHASFVSNGIARAWYRRLVLRLDVGVAIFFVIAGFLLFRPYVAAHVDGLHAPGYGRYLFRRALRILPGYWVALSVLALLGLVLLDSRFWEQYGLVQVYDRPEVLNGIVAAWSLATEVAFYLLLPVLVSVLMLDRASTRTARVRSAGLMAAALWGWSALFNLWLRNHQGSRPSVWFNALPGTLDWFALGMGLAVLSVALTGVQRPPRIVAFLERWPGASWLAAAGLFAYVSLAIGAPGAYGVAPSTGGYVVRHLLYGAIAALVVAPAVFSRRRGTVVHRVLGHPILSAIGVISYGIFLYNGPVVVWIGDHHALGLGTGRPFLGDLALALVVTLPVAALSYRLVERPFLRLKNLGMRPRLVPGAAAASLPTAPRDDQGR
jgi:peptidoglycan/LPS O-acetylase OafA/YrhL